MSKDGFTMMEEDHCLYIKRSNIGFIILSFCVDDILIAGSDKKLIYFTKKWLSSNFKMKDMGEASYVLGVKIFRDRSKDLFMVLSKHQDNGTLNFIKPCQMMVLR